MWDARPTRTPALLLRLSGALWLRYVARALSWSLAQEPPRATRRAGHREPHRSRPARPVKTSARECATGRGTLQKKSLQRA